MSELFFAMDMIDVHASKEEFKEFLISFCDDDYNGNNGKEYFVKVNGKFASRFDHAWRKVQDETIADIAHFILEDNYSDSYYAQHKFAVALAGDKLVISLAYIS